MRRLLRLILPKTLLGRSLIIIVTPLVLIQVVMAFQFYDSHWFRSNAAIAAGIAGDVAVIAEHFHTYPGDENRAWMASRAAEGMGLQVLYRQGETLSDEPPFVSKWSAPFFLTGALDDVLRLPYRIDGRRFPQEVYIDIQVSPGVLRVVVPQQRFAVTNTYLFVLWMGGTSLILFALAVAFMGTQTRPIRRLAQAADAFGKGRDVPGFRPAGAAEVRQAAAAFLTMKTRIQRQMSQRVEMLAGVSHDLKTPLTRMKLQLAMLGDTPEIEDLKGDIAELESMLEGYLAFARGEGAEEPALTDIAELLNEIVEAARREGTAIDFAGPPDKLELPLRPVALRRAITNLIINARNYARTIRVTARRLDHAVEILFDDDGPGIPDEEMESVFKPFYRVEPSRNRETGGTGLGLTIARDIVQGHGGDITLARSPLGGLRVRVSLPL